MTILAQDPGIEVSKGKPLLATVEVPDEHLLPGPRGHRIYVVDYDITSDRFYQPLDYAAEVDKRGPLPYATYDLDRILADPGFHAANAYAISMRVLARFQRALGRRVEWRLPGHQLKLMPHAFADANAFYSPAAEGVLFGYFRDEDDRTIYTSLSHDVVAHEVTHALLDGLRDHFTEPSSNDQAAFHEGFADIVALLSVFAVPEVVAKAIDLGVAHNDQERKDPEKPAPDAESPSTPGRYVRVQDVSFKALSESVLGTLAKEMGSSLSKSRGNALRESLKIKASTKLLDSDEYAEPHRRGEILVAATLGAFIEEWRRRIGNLRRHRIGGSQKWFYDRREVARVGSETADYLLTAVIRALDYTPPIHIRFPDFLAAVLTADTEVNPPSTTRALIHGALTNRYRAFGLTNAPGTGADGTWEPASRSIKVEALRYENTHHASMQSNRDEVFQFAWNNRSDLGLIDEAYTEVTSIRPVARVSPVDGFALRETVVEIVQRLEVTPPELAAFGIESPEGMPASTRLLLVGGATLIFDEYGQLKFRVPNALPRSGSTSSANTGLARLYSERLASVWQRGRYVEGAGKSLLVTEDENLFRELHAMRGRSPRRPTSREQW